MPQPDILLERDRVSVVGGTGPEETDGTERGDLEITTSQGRQASIKLNADRANVTVGGGEGAAPEGDLRLLDRNENPRVQVSAEAGNKNQPRENAVWVQGETGRVALGNVSESGTVDPSITMSGSSGRIELHDPSLNRFDGGAGGPSITLDGETATVVAGSDGSNPNPTPGRLSVRNRDGDRVVEVTGEVGGGSRPRAGTASFYDATGNKTAELRGDRAALKLGFHDPPEGVGSPTERYVPAAGQGGTILLNDGGRRIVGATVFQIEAREGQLEIGTVGGQTVFALDAKGGSVKIPQSWSYDKF